MKNKSKLQYPIRKFGVPAAIIIICAALIYWHLAVGVALEGGFAWDAPIMLALHSLSQPWLDMVFYYITKTAELFLVLPVLAMFIYLWRRSERITAVLYITAVIAFPLIGTWLKELFGRPRQNLFPPLVVEQTYSFPSGHTLTAVAVYGLAAVLLWQRGHHILALLSAFWALAVGLSRVYLGAHYPSDVLASLALGMIMVIIVLFINGQLNAWVLKRQQRVGQPAA